MIQNLNGDATSGAMHYAISENGTLAYIPGLSEGENRKLIRINFDGTIDPLDAPVQAYIEPRISPDGKKIAMVVGSGKDFDIWTYELANGNMTRLTFGGINRTPNWSPDNKSIAYYSYNDGESFIKIKQANGSGGDRTLYSQKSRLYIDSWSPDGSLLVVDGYFGSQQSGLSVIKVEDPKELETYINTDADEYMGDLSPDGKWLAYVSNETGPYEVYIQTFPEKGGKWQISLNSGLEPHWSADGKKLFFTSGNKIIEVPIEIKDGALIPGKQTVVSENYSFLPVDSGISYDVSPVADYFIATQPASISSFKKVQVIVNWFSEVQKMLQQDNQN